MGQTEHKPNGWPNSIKWDNWKSHTSKKEQSRLIYSQFPWNEIPDIVNSSVENSADKSTIESEDGGKESRKKQKIDDD